MPLINMDEGVVFSSGRELDANRGIVGINQKLEIYEGYDGGIDWPNNWNEYATQYDANDMTELADEMIRRWTEFKAKVNKQEVKITQANLPKGNFWDEDGACFEAIEDKMSLAGWRWAAKNAKALGKGNPDKPLFDFFMPTEWTKGEVT